ncbi:MAG: RluA family pseudouridine synthase [Hyphomicrobiales bacterium]
MTDALSATAAGPERLDRFLAQQFPEVSRARFQKLVAAGAVRVDGAVVDDAGLKLKAGQAVAVTLPPAVAAEPVAQDMALDVVFEDKHLIVVNKPAGLVVHPAAGHEDGTLVNALIAHCGESLSGIGGVKRPGIVHRLDKDTSGLLVVAKTDQAHQGLSEQFAAHGRDGRMAREYLAFVWGVPERPAGTIATGIGRSTSNRQKQAVSNRSDAREAVTHYQTEKTFGTAASLVRCRLETGRTHQIRVHMAHGGHPLLGDMVYGAGFKSALARLSPAAQIAVKSLKGQALHAAVLGFEHPVSGRKLRFEAPLPEDLANLLRALGP